MLIFNLRPWAIVFLSGPARKGGGVEAKLTFLAGFEKIAKKNIFKPGGVPPRKVCTLGRGGIPRVGRPPGGGGCPPGGRAPPRRGLPTQGVWVPHKGGGYTRGEGAPQGGGCPPGGRMPPRGESA